MKIDKLGLAAAISNIVDEEELVNIESMLPGVSYERYQDFVEGLFNVKKKLKKLDKFLETTTIDIIAGTDKGAKRKIQVKLSIMNLVKTKLPKTNMKFVKNEVLELKTTKKVNSAFFPGMYKIEKTVESVAIEDLIKSAEKNFATEIIIKDTNGINEFLKALPEGEVRLSKKNQKLLKKANEIAEETAKEYSSVYKEISEAIIEQKREFIEYLDEELKDCGCEEPLILTVYNNLKKNVEEHEARL